MIDIDRYCIYIIIHQYDLPIFRDTWAWLSHSEQRSLGDAGLMASVRRGVAMEISLEPIAVLGTADSSRLIFFDTEEHIEIHI